MNKHNSIAQQLALMAQQSGLKTWTLAGRVLLPVVQGGMGVGVSAGRLAGTVAVQGGVGTIPPSICSACVLT